MAAIATTLYPETWNSLGNNSGMMNPLHTVPLGQPTGALWNTFQQKHVAGPNGTGRPATRNEELLLHFGPPLKDVRQNPYDTMPNENEILPEAWNSMYKGNNVHMSILMLNAITTKDSVFMQDVSPWKVFTGEPTVKIERIIFNDNRLDRYVEQGVPRYLTKQRESWNQTIGRCGIAFLMESGFAMTDAGRRDYHYSMLQIRDATLREAFLSCIWLLINHVNPRLSWSTAYGAEPGSSLRQVLRQECMMWNCMNKRENAIMWLRDLVTKAMAVWQGSFDTLITHQGCQQIYKLIHKEDTKYNEAGPEGPASMRSKNGPMRKYLDNILVHEFDAVNVEPGKAPEDLLVTKTNFGEYVLVNMGNFIRRVPAAQYHSQLADPRFLDHSRNSVTTHSFEQYFGNTGLFYRPNTRPDPAHPGRKEPKGKLTDLGKAFFGAIPTLSAYLENRGAHTRAYFKQTLVNAITARPALYGEIIDNLDHTDPTSHSAPFSGFHPTDEQLIQAIEQFAECKEGDTRRLVSSGGISTMGPPLAEHGLPAEAKGEWAPEFQELYTSLKNGGVWQPLRASTDRLSLKMVATMADACNKDATRKSEAEQTRLAKALQEMFTKINLRLHGSPKARELFEKFSSVLQRIFYPDLDLVAFRALYASVNHGWKALLRMMMHYGCLETSDNTAQRTRAMGLGPGSNSVVSDDSSPERQAETIITRPVTSLTYSVIKLFYEHNVLFPFNVLLVRLNVCYAMASFIFVKRGRETMSTYIGKLNFQLGADVNRKMLTGHFTCYLGPVITKPENIYIAHNVQAVDYCAGGDDTYWDPMNVKDVRAYNRESMNKKSIHAIALPIGEVIREDWFDVTGDIPKECKGRVLNEDGTEKQLMYSTARIYASKWGWMHPEKYFPGLTPLHQSTGGNTRVFQATQFVAGVDGHGGIDEEKYVVPGTGPFGASVYLGCVDDYCGRGNGLVIPASICLAKSQSIGHQPTI